MLADPDVREWRACVELLVHLTMASTYQIIRPGHTQSGVSFAFKYHAVANAPLA